MPRSSHPAIIVVNVCLLPLGLVTLAAGLAGFVAMNEMWWAFGLLAVGGAVIMGGAVHEIRAWGKRLVADEHTAHEMLSAVRAGQIAPSAAAAAPRRATDPVLARWTYAPDEWRAYADAEMRLALREAAMMAFTIVLLGTVLIGVLDREWEAAFILSLATSVFVAGGRLLMAWLAHRRHRSVAAGEVIVGPRAMLVNGRYETVHDGSRIRFSRAQVREGTRPALLVVEITVPGRYRRLPDEYRVPIPAGREDEARAVAQALNQAYVALPASAGAVLPHA